MDNPVHCLRQRPELNGTLQSKVGPLVLSDAHAAYLVAIRDATGSGARQKKRGSKKRKAQRTEDEGMQHGLLKERVGLRNVAAECGLEGRSGRNCQSWRPLWASLDPSCSRYSRFHGQRRTWML